MDQPLTQKTTYRSPSEREIKTQTQQRSIFSREKKRKDEIRNGERVGRVSVTCTLSQQYQQRMDTPIGVRKLGLAGGSSDDFRLKGRRMSAD